MLTILRAFPRLSPPSCPHVQKSVSTNECTASVVTLSGEQKARSNGKWVFRIRAATGGSGKADKREFFRTTSERRSTPPSDLRSSFSLGFLDVFERANEYRPLNTRSYTICTILPDTHAPYLALKRKKQFTSVFPTPSCRIGLACGFRFAKETHPISIRSIIDICSNVGSRKKGDDAMIGIIERLV